MRMKTTASKPDIDKSSSSEVCQALLTQPVDGSNLSKLKSDLPSDFRLPTSRGA